MTCVEARADLQGSHSRPETREGQQRPINKDYYYVDYHATIDAIKYRVFHLTEEVKKLYKPSEEKKDYVCKNCEAQWTRFEVLDKFDPMLGFECHRCGNILDELQRAEGSETGHAKQSRLMSQLAPLLKILQQVDSEDIPSNDFERAYANRVATPHDESYNIGSRPSVPLVETNGRPASVKGMTQLAAPQLDVSVTTNSDKTAAEKAAEAEERARIAKQNALPEWHVKSTVTGESVDFRKKDSDAQVNGISLAKDEHEETKDTIALNDELADYYAQIEREKAQELKEEEEAEESSADDGEDFEDVGIADSSADSPSSLMSIPQINGNPPTKTSASGSSVGTSNVATPADISAAVEDAGHVAKKVKFDTPEFETSAISRVSEDRNAEKDSNEEEEAEFEDC